jgi:hypothetical protein
MSGLERKAAVGLRPSFSAHVRWCEHGAPVRSCQARDWLGGEACGIRAIYQGKEPKRLVHGYRATIASYPFHLHLKIG